MEGILETVVQVVEENAERISEPDPWAQIKTGMVRAEAAPVVSEKKKERCGQKWWRRAGVRTDSSLINEVLCDLEGHPATALELATLIGSLTEARISRHCEYWVKCSPFPCGQKLVEKPEGYALIARS